MYHYGARHNLEALITTHLFVISPNNSGSTFVKNALATCSTTWNLRREGQHVFGFPGPSPRALDFSYVWAAETESLAVLSNSEAFDWELARKTWYFQAFSTNPNATVFVEKSPPFLLHVKALSHHFSNPKFLFMVRDPYAMAEGILRATGPYYSSREISLLKAATHVSKCLELQANNVSRFSDQAIFFTYEELCRHPTRIAQNVVELVPELASVIFDQKVSVKGNYDEPLRNMNDQQIGRLSSRDIDTLNQVFSHHQKLINGFGYELLA